MERDDGRARLDHQPGIDPGQRGIGRGDELLRVQGCGTAADARCGAQYAADKIHINAIQPGFTDTHFLETLYATAPGGKVSVDKHLSVVHPWGRTGRPEDIARVAVFLAGDGVSWVTGTSIVADGGYLAQ